MVLMNLAGPDACRNFTSDLTHTVNSLTGSGSDRITVLYHSLE